MHEEQFIDAYIETALWSSMEYDQDGTMGLALEENYGPEDLAPETREEIETDCRDFIESNFNDLAEVTDWAACGQDFWLTRNHHGAGFWDRGLGALGERLSAAAHFYGSVDLFIGDDGQIYL